jgi:hypothetical protein
MPQTAILPRLPSTSPWSLDMSKHLDVAKTGLALGAVFAGWHLCWSLLVALGWAQPVIDFVFWMHFIKPIYVIEPFALDRAAMLVGLTAIVGFLIGAMFAWVWNVVHKS